MTLLRDVRPADFLRAGAVFGQVAEQVSEGIAQARSSAEVRWVGRPNQQYQKQLGRLVGDLTRIQRAYDDACDALLAYSRALGPVRDLALQADLVAAHAEDLRQGRDLVPGFGGYSQVLFSPITPAEQALVERAGLLREEAADQERVASARLVAVMRALAEDAPHLNGWASADRFTSDAVTSVGQQAAGVGQLASDVVVAVPLLGDAGSRARARGELWAAAGAAVQPWLAIEDILANLRGGRSGLAAGAVVFTAATHKTPVPLRVGEYDSRFGLYAAMDAHVLRALQHVDGAAPEDLGLWVTRRQQQRFSELFESLKAVPLPPVQVWLDDGVDLLHHEAAGGHTLLKHVGRDADFLQARSLAEPRNGVTGPRSSFLSGDEAHRLIDEALRANKVQLLALESAKEKGTIVDFDIAGTGGLVLDSDGQHLRAVRLRLVLRRNASGQLHIYSAYLRAA